MALASSCVLVTTQSISPLPGANVFVASNGRLKLGDFGLSFQLRNTSHSVLDGIAENVGTVPYMAPEVIRSGKTHHIGRASDIWSVGCTVIEMITGKVSVCGCYLGPSGPQPIGGWLTHTPSPPLPFLTRSPGPSTTTTCASCWLWATALPLRYPTALVRKGMSSSSSALKLNPPSAGVPLSFSTTPLSRSVGPWPQAKHACMVAVDSVQPSSLHYWHWSC